MPPVLCALVTVLLLGCDPSAQDTPDARRDEPKTVMVLECADTFTLVAEFGETSVWGFFPDSTVQLPHVPSGSGAQYRSGPYLPTDYVRNDYGKALAAGTARGPSMSGFNGG